MIVDIDKSAPDPSAGRYDVCIAGGGVAGITLAYTLAARGQRILLLEAGGLEYTDESQSVYKGDNVGDEYFDLDVARLRYLGGRRITGRAGAARSIHMISKSTLT